MYFIVQTVALSLLLVFRTNAAYGRWDEARKMKGLLLNRSRDLMRQVQEGGGLQLKCDTEQFEINYTSVQLLILHTHQACSFAP